MDMTAHKPAPFSPTIDHIIPLAQGGSDKLYLLDDELLVHQQAWVEAGNGNAQ